MRFQMSTSTMFLLAISIIGLILYFASNMAAVDYFSVAKMIVLGG